MPEVDVMTWNLYVGSDFQPIFSARSVEELLSGAAAVYEEILAADFGARAERAADEIARTRPDLVGVQEMALFRSAPLADPEDSETVVLDHLQALLDALRARGASYSVLGEAAGIDAQLPRDENTRVRLTNRDVLLVRGDVGLQSPEVATGRYRAATSFATAAGPIEFPRSWVSIDARLAGSLFRMITTHLEVPTDDDAQAAQADELLAGRGGSDAPTIVVGDLNAAAPLSPVYRKFLDAGFVDAWSALHPDDPGLTCCQDPRLQNERSELHERIDFVLIRGLDVAGIDRVGADPSSRTAGGLWPSDHAGLVATLRLQN